MPQYGQPSSDIIVGSWEPSVMGSTLYEMIDGLTPNDSTYISDDAGTYGTQFEVGLGNLLKPVDGAQTLKCRLKSDSDGGIPFSICLVEGGTIISFKNVRPTTSWNDYSLTISDDEKKQISNYGALSMRILINASDSCLSCSPIVLPLVLNARVTLGSGCGDSADIPLVNPGGGSNEWDGQGTIGTSGSTIDLAYVCLSGLSYVIDGCCNEFGSCQDGNPPDTSCNPFYANFTGLQMDEACCSGGSGTHGLAVEITD